MFSRFDRPSSFPSVSPRLSKGTRCLLASNYGDNRWVPNSSRSTWSLGIANSSRTDTKANLLWVCPLAKKLGTELHTL